MAAFAIVQDVEDRWRPLSTDERVVAATLIEDASDMIRVRWPDVDDRISASSLSDGTVKRVVAGMVRRAMLNRDAEGVVQMQTTTGPFSDGATYTNPNNNLYLSAEDILALGGQGYGVRVRQAWL